MGETLPSTGMWQDEVFAISDCLLSLSQNMMIYLVHVDLLTSFVNRSSCGNISTGVGIENKIKSNVYIFITLPL